MCLFSVSFSHQFRKKKNLAQQFQCSEILKEMNTTIKTTATKPPLCNVIDKIVRVCMCFILFCFCFVLWLTNVCMRATQSAQLNVVAQFKGITNNEYDDLRRLWYVWCFKFISYMTASSPVFSINFRSFDFYVPYVLNCLYTLFLLPYTLWQYSFVHCWTSRVSCINVWVCVNFVGGFYLFLLIIYSMWREYGHTIFGSPLVHQNRLYLLLLCVSVFLFILTFFSMLIMKISYTKSTQLVSVAKWFGNHLLQFQLNRSWVWTKTTTTTITKKKTYSVLTNGGHSTKKKVHRPIVIFSFKL